MEFKFSIKKSNSIAIAIVNNFNNRIKNNIKTIKRLPKIKGTKEIMYPGQNKYKRFKMNLKKEIRISEVIKKDLKILKS